MIGGTDLLRCAAHIEGRKRVILIDAIESDIAGDITVTDEDPPDSGTTGAHTLSAPTAARLLRHLMPEVRFTWMLVGIPSARVGEALSPELHSALPRLRQCLAELAALTR